MKLGFILDYTQKILHACAFLDKYDHFMTLNWLLYHLNVLMLLHLMLNFPELGYGILEIPKITRMHVKHVHAHAF